MQQKKFSENLLAIEIKKTQIFMKKPGMSILYVSEIVMYEFLYDYMKPKYGEEAKLCYMDIETFIVYIKTEDIYSNIENIVEARSDTSIY